MAVAMKSAIVTGGGRGLGRAIAAALLAHGYRVILAECDAAAGAAAVDALAGRGALELLVLDITAPEAGVQLAAQVTAGLDLLVNNAAVIVRKPLAEISPAEWRRVLEVNLTAPFLLSRALAPQLRARNGAIINLASTRALMSEPDTESYAAAKGGLVALTHALAISLGPQVRVNCISPGWIDVRPQPAAPLTAADHAQHPAGRVGRPEDIADLVLYLAGATFVTGQNFVVDGGMTRKMIYCADE